MTPLNRQRVLTGLMLLKLILILVMVLMFVTFNARIAEQSRQTNRIAMSTNKITKGQADILTAIKQVTDDTHTTAAQQTAIIICMLQVPVVSRTAGLQQTCQKAVGAEAPGSDTGTKQSSVDTTPVDSSSKSTPTSAPLQSNSSQVSEVTKQPTFLGRALNSIINGMREVL